MDKMIIYVVLYGMLLIICAHFVFNIFFKNTISSGTNTGTCQRDLRKRLVLRLLCEGHAIEDIANMTGESEKNIIKLERVIQDNKLKAELSQIRKHMVRIDRRLCDLERTDDAEAEVPLINPKQGEK